jgi:hypothetical protein
MTNSMQVETKYRDPLRRFTTTPLTADLQVMGRTVRLETNSATVLERMVRLLEPYQGSPSASSGVLWRIVGEADSGVKPPWPEMTAFSDDGLRYVNLGQRGFFAVDLEAREAIAFLSEELARDEVGFNSVFVATLFDLTAGALGLIPVSAACVSRGGKALLIFGPPRSGKTTSTYLAGRLGLQFSADQATFLELERSGLRAWGQFWPAAFRPETKLFMPELASSTRSFTYGSLTFLCFDKHPFQPPVARSVVPVGCVFLERQSVEVPRLTRLTTPELDGRLQEELSFKDDERFEAQCATALGALAELPAYRLAYGNDPTVAAGFYPGLLAAL